MKGVNKYRKLAPLFLRWGIALVFIFIGARQLLNPNAFPQILPDWVFVVPYIQNYWIYARGALVLFFGFLLLLGLFSRLSAFVLGTQLFVFFLFDLNEVSIEQVGLLFSTIAIFLIGSDVWSLDAVVAKKLPRWMHKMAYVLG